MSEPLEESCEPPEIDEASESQITRALMTELVRIRKKRKIGQEPVAKAIGISQGRLSQIENLKGGSMTLDAFIVYARTIGAEVTVLPPKKRKGE